MDIFLWYTDTNVVLPFRQLRNPFQTAAIRKHDVCQSRSPPRSLLYMLIITSLNVFPYPSACKKKRTYLITENGRRQQLFIYDQMPSKKCKTVTTGSLYKNANWKLFICCSTQIFFFILNLTNRPFIKITKTNTQSNDSSIKQNIFEKNKNQHENKQTCSEN